MPKTESQEKFFNALNDSYEAIIEAIKAGNERGYRFSKTLIEEVEKGQKEVLELAKKWAGAPTDVPGFLGSVVEAMAKAQSRGLVLARDWLLEASEARSEAREAIQRVVSANQAATQAAVEAARGLFTSAAEAARPGARQAQREADRGGDLEPSPSLPETTSPPPTPETTSPQ
jgi:CubicO group peptidase (beta-lactamase class C family)